MIKLNYQIIFKSIIYFIIQEIKFLFRKIKYIYFFLKHINIVKYIICRKKDYRIIKNSAQKKALEKNYNFWKKSIKRNKEDDVLITSLVDVKDYVIGNAIIGKILSKISNKNPVALIKEYDFRTEIFIKSFDINKIHYVPEGNFFSRIKFLFISLKLIKNIRETDDLIKLKYQDIDIGLAVYDHYIRFTGVGSIKIINHKIVYFLSKALLVQSFAKKLFKLNSFKEVIQSEQQFIPSSIIFQNSLLNNCKVFSRIGVGNKMSVMIYKDFKNRHKDKYRFSKELFNLAYKNYNSNIASKVDHLITERFKGNIKYSIDHNIEEHMAHKFIDEKNLKYNYTKNELCKKFNWDINKPIVIIFASDLTDGVFRYEWKIFKDNLTGLQETIKIIKEAKNINWLIKSHPNDIKLKVITTTDIEVSNLSKEYKHIRLFPKNLGNGPLPKIITAAVTMAGTVGYEYPSLGVPTIVATGSIYTGRGFNYEGRTINEYKKMLINADKLTPLSNEQISKAKNFLYIYSFLAKVNSSLMPEQKIISYHKNYDDVAFWQSFENLANNYNFEEDPFYKNFKIQLEKNDRHTINYNLLN